VPDRKPALEAKRYSRQVWLDWPIELPVMPPVAPMLARPAATIPGGQFYEPKWDGFRSIVFRDGDEVEIGSRKERPMTRYFPEVVDAVRRSSAPSRRAR
jgi:ATP-dependent DNA ligase